MLEGLFDWEVKSFIMARTSPQNELTSSTGWKDKVMAHQADKFRQKEPVSTKCSPCQSITDLNLGLGLRPIAGADQGSARFRVLSPSLRLSFSISLSHLCQLDMDKRTGCSIDQHLNRILGTSAGENNPEIAR